jgi:mannose-6-phosphate isomerase-like protein (cupin superfamily)
MKLSNVEGNLLRGGNLLPVEVPKDWGSEILLGVAGELSLKELHVKPGEKLSRQLHPFNTELYYVLQGEGCVELGSQSEFTHALRAGNVLRLPPLAVHRLIAAETGIVIIEASLGGVNDTMRLEDKYGRDCTAPPNFDWKRYLLKLYR